MATGPESLRVLLVEDDEDDYRHTRELLSAQDQASYELEWSADHDDALTLIREQRHDVYLIDYFLGKHNGLDLVRAGFAARPAAPVILLTGQTDYEVDLEATALGVTDYLVKQDLDTASLERSIRYAVSHQRTIRDLARSEERYALAVRATSDGIWDWDLADDRIYFSPRWHEIMGRPESTEQHLPAVWLDLVHGDDVGPFRAAIAAHVAGATSHLETELRMRHAGGEWRWIRVLGLTVRDAGGEATRLAGSMSDITERRSAERLLEHDALHDALTALPNRTLFMDRVDHVLRAAVRDPAAGCAVLFLDLDRFKLVNDTLSHAVGDRLLIAVANRLSGAVRPGDTVARLGGDEFTVLLPEVCSPVAATTVADRLHRALTRVFRVDGHELFLTGSIGISLSAPQTSAADLLRNADIAMYEAKRKGLSRPAVFSDEMRRRMVERLTRENDLRRAVEEGLMRVHFQPIVDLESGRISAVEALARWPAEWDEVSPADFIPVAEETGLVDALGLYVLRTALGDLARWRREGLVGEDFRMSVNLSGRQLEEPGLTRTVRDVLAEFGLPGEALALEITENVLMHDSERLRSVLADLCAAGASLHLDDFGTGYSSLSALHHYPVDALKIDRSFVASLGATNGSEMIVASAVTLAHSLEMTVIAEGIEEAAQVQELCALGCELGQGFLFARPASAADTEGLLRAGLHSLRG
jgi:diguanylate cyclase (GGDEF)-like protein/PAS domain S-box-containing protein